MMTTYLIHYPGGSNLLADFWALAEDISNTMCTPVKLIEHKRPEQHTTWLLRTDITPSLIGGYLKALTKGEFLLLPLGNSSVFSGMTSVHKAVYGLDSDEVVNASLAASSCSKENLDTIAAAEVFARRLAQAHPIPVDDVLDKMNEVGIQHLNPLEIGSLYLASDEMTFDDVSTLHI